MINPSTVVIVYYSASCCLEFSADIPAAQALAERWIQHTRLDHLKQPGKNSALAFAHNSLLRLLRPVHSMDNVRDRDQ